MCIDPCTTVYLVKASAAKTALMEVQLAICFLSILFSSSLSSPPVEIAGDALNYLVIGDWGGTEVPPYYTPAEHTLARVMGQKAQEIGSDFTVAMGDNFYSHGVKNVDDPRFKETFEVRERCNRAMSINTHANHCHILWFCRMSFQLTLSRSVGMFSVVITIITGMQLHKLHTQRSPHVGTCLTCTILK